MRQRREYCGEGFAGGLCGIDVLLLEVDADTERLQFSHGLQTFFGVACEAGSGLDKNAVNAAVAAVFHHPQEVIPLFDGCAGDTLIGIDVCKYPVWIAVDELCKVSGLGCIGVELIVGVRADAGVCRHPEGAREILPGGRDGDDPRLWLQGERACGFLAVVHCADTSFFSNTQYHEAFAIAIPKSEKSERNNDVRAKLYHQTRGDLFCFAATDKSALPQTAEQGDDAKIICVGIHLKSSFLILVMKTPEPVCQMGLGVLTTHFYRYYYAALHLVSLGIFYLYFALHLI